MKGNGGWYAAWNIQSSWRIIPALLNDREQNTQTRSMFQIWLNNILLVHHRTNSDGQMCQGPLASLPWHLSNSTVRLNGMCMVIMLCPNWFSCSTQPEPTTTPQYAAALRDEPCVAMGTVNTQGPNKATGNICIRAQSALSNRWLRTYNSAHRPDCSARKKIPRESTLTFWLLACNRRFCRRGESQSPWWRCVWNTRRFQTLRR